MGGIERVCRILGMSLFEIEDKDPQQLSIYSMHDDSLSDVRYFPGEVYKAFGQKRVRFVVDSIVKGVRADRVVISHINLLVVAFAIKVLSPRTKLVLLAHGIEVWKPLGAIRRFMLRRLDVI